MKFRYNFYVDKLYCYLRIDETHYTIASNWTSKFKIPLSISVWLHLAVSYTAHLDLLTEDKKIVHAAKIVGVGVKQVKIQ